jgi:hypothetical protein
MNSPITDRGLLLRATAATLQMLRDEQTLESADVSSADAIGKLEAALKWADEEDVPEPALESAAPGLAEPYVPSNATLSLVQSAFDEFVKAKKEAGLPIPFDPATDPGFNTIAAEKVKAAQRGAHPFIQHETIESFRYHLPDDAVVALFADWGTGEPTAQRVMDQIKLCNPTHAIHLGDVYYSGTPDEVKSRFLDIIDDHGPSRSTCKYFALPGNHDMYSGGYAFFDTVIPFCGIQEGSYFNLRNAHWQLIGLDSGYNEYDLYGPQPEWLSGQLAAAPSPKSSIVLSHHQLFSPYDKRTLGQPLLAKAKPLLADVYAWFWGHEHRCVVMGEHMEIKARCIGHGAMPTKVPFGAPLFPDVPVAQVDERASSSPEGGVIHGFALLRFAGDRIDVSYIDEFGDEFFREQFT